MNEYKTLNKQSYSDGNLSIVPIRFEDRYHIMKWRNEQIYHLRQKNVLTKNDQDDYFNGVIKYNFDQIHPNQILFSYIEKLKCIGYGGLVHINWTDKNAEISFIMDTNLEERFFEFHWSTFLKLIEQVAFRDLELHKIFIFAFDLRPHLYPILKKNNYFLDAVLKDHCFFNNHFIDVVIHSKIYQK